MPNSIAKNITNLLLKTFLISVLATLLILQVITASTSQNLESNQAAFIENLSNVVWIFVLSIGSMVSYLNSGRKFRGNKILRFLSFFLIPCLLISITQLKGGEGTNFTTFYISSGCYLSVLSYFYLNFNKKTNLE